MDPKNLSIAEFLSSFNAGNLDVEGFYDGLFRELQIINKKYNLLTFIGKKPDYSKNYKAKKIPYLPFTVKDCICVKGFPSAAGSKILREYIPSFDATSVDRLKNEGGQPLGKTQQDEFGFGTFSINSGLGIPLNPLDPTRSCGGSSGGAAGLLKALSYPHFALAESTGGSISCPASFCGVAGLTPTYGLVSRFGLIDYANSLDKIGIMGRKTGDLALILDIISGKDPRDMTSVNPAKKSRERPEKGRRSPDSLGKSDPPEKGRIGIPKEYMQDIERDVEKAVWEEIHNLEKQGVAYKEISLPMTKHVVAAYYIIATAEASTNLARYCGLRYGAQEDIHGTFSEYASLIRSRYFGEEAKRRIMLGTFARMAGYRDHYYLKALQVRTLIIEEFKKALKHFDALVSPTMPIKAPKFSEIRKLTSLRHYMMDILTVGPNLAGLPMLSVPCKTSGMPVGLHIIGDYLDEQKILDIGKLVEEG